MAILLAIDDSDPARKAMKHVFSEHSDEEITVLHVLRSPESLLVGEARMYVDWDEITDKQQELTEELFAEANELAAAHNVTISTETAMGRPDRAIVEYAQQHDIDHVFVGSHGRSGISHVLLGSVAENVVRRAPVPVTVIR
jgi:nucleotide-binding universal stress UspA family protein